MLELGFWELVLVYIWATGSIPQKFLNLKWGHLSQRGLSEIIQVTHSV